MRKLLFLSLTLISYVAYSSTITDSLFDKLKFEIGQKKVYDDGKEAKIKALKKLFNAVPKNNLQKQFTACLKIYDEYKSYQYDSAYVYASKLQQISGLLNDRSKINLTKIKMGFIYLSSGLFKETFENFKGIDVHNLDDSLKIEYYSIMQRAYYDVASYDNDTHFAPGYNILANQYIDSAIALSKPGSYDRIYLSGYKKLKNGYLKEAGVDFDQLIKQNHLTTHQYAIVASSLSNIFLKTNRQDECTDLLIEATIDDIKSSTKETVALFWLAQLLYKNGDIKNAYFYLQQALTDAEFYGARQRKIQIGTLLPIVAAENITYTEYEKGRVLKFLMAITALALLVIWFSVILIRQLNTLKAKEKVIDDKNIQLEKINEKLLEGTKIKEEYIGYFFNVISGYILQLEKIKRSVDMKLHAKKYEDIQIIIDKINIKKDRDNLFYTFDHVFIKIFPNFITEFNALFKPEDQIWPKEDEVLTTDLRIFALIRMGISDTETIAKILEYSEKTIYVYKMRIKAKSLIHGDHFEQKIMAIKAVDINSKA